MTTHQPQPPPVPSGPNMGMQAAKASWMAPIVGIALNVMTASSANTRQAKLVIGFSSFAIYILGLVLGIIALLLIRKHGRKGILAPAIVGVVINGALVAVFCFVLIGIFLR